MVIEVDDPLGHAAGRWQVAPRPAGPRSPAPTTPPDVRLAADTLGSLYLGGVSVADAARRPDGWPATTTAVATLAAMADGGPTPYCITGF